MPNPKAGTITFDLERAIGEVKGGRVEFKVDKAGIVHTAFGRSSYEADALVANLAALVDAVNRARPAGAQGQNLKTLTIAATMGPGLRVDVPAVLAAANAASGGTAAPAGRRITRGDGPRDASPQLKIDGTARDSLRPRAATSFGG
jgi:hypothetical protein